MHFLSRLLAVASAGSLRRWRSRACFRSLVLEQARELGEVGVGLQVAPNALSVLQKHACRFGLGRFGRVVDGARSSNEVP